MNEKDTAALIDRLKFENEHLQKENRRLSAQERDVKERQIQYRAALENFEIIERGLRTQLNAKVTKDTYKLQERVSLQAKKLEEAATELCKIPDLHIAMKSLELALKNKIEYVGFTCWFPRSDKPIRPGRYLCRGVTKDELFIDTWNGTDWSKSTKTVMQWCGLIDKNFPLELN